MIRATLGLLVAIGLTACSLDDRSDGSTPTPSEPASEAGFVTPLPDIFDCVRENGGVFLAAHRGGPKPGFPENTLETMIEAYENGIRVFEIDVQTSSDGILYLLHDNTLSRTTTGRARADEESWETISRLSTIDQEQRVTRINPTKLEDVLLWAREAGAIVEIDKKPTSGWLDILDMVQSTNSANHVILITYTSEDASYIHSLAPDLMLSVGLVDNKLPRGVDPRIALAWTGTRSPSPGFWRSLRNRGIEPLFGTLGRPETRLDDIYLADGNPSEYEDMIEQGLVMLATDRATELAALLDEDDQAIGSCLN